MTRRLLFSYLLLAVLILGLLEIPLGALASRHEYDQTTSQAEREAEALAALASEDIEHNRLADLKSIFDRYQARTGGEVSAIGPFGQVLATTATDSDNDVTGKGHQLVQAALAGRQSSSMVSDDDQPWAEAAVPIATDGKAMGAILLGLRAGATERRVHAIWLALAGFAVGVLVVTAAVGARLARSVSRPLARLEAAVGQLGAGDLGVRAEMSGPPEVQSLATQFNRMAVRLSELMSAQSRFVADASHQLRSPLTALRLRLENLEADASGRPAEALAAAVREVQRLSRVVDGLLTLSRAEGVSPHRERVDVVTIVDERCEAWSALAEEQRVTVVPPNRNGFRVRAQLVPGDLDQIVDNLLANAVDASPPGGTVSVRLEAPAPGQLELHVVDEGHGMSDEDRERAFDRFWQGAHRPGHSGLGLAIVHQMAMRNDATVELRSAQATGIDAVVRMAGDYEPDSSETVKKSRDSRVGPR